MVVRRRVRSWQRRARTIWAAFRTLPFELRMLVGTTILLLLGADIKQQRCGDHSAKTYLNRVNDLTRKFSRLAAGDSLLRFVRPQ